jgi:uncharacterized membrane protein YphA (DoxX/SURF4 family)
LQKYYSNFPGNMPGIGLLILRTTTGVAAALYGVIFLSRLETPATGQFLYFGHLILGLSLILSGIFLVLGLLMPFVSIALAAFELAAAGTKLMSADRLPEKTFIWMAMLLLTSTTIALFFLGPGAFSIDAKLYGRREIFLPSPKKRERTEL